MLLQATTPDTPGLDLRQLRHHTKNALACILAQVSSELSTCASSRRLADAVERRVLLTARISDALFGLTRAPGPFSERLTALCEGIVELMGEDGQCIDLSCDVRGEVPLEWQEAVLRVAHEFVGNAVKHGMHVRLVGCVEVRVVADHSGTRLFVTDDGWGCGSAPRMGEGMSVAAGLAKSVGGRVTLARADGRTQAGLLITQGGPVT